MNDIADLAQEIAALAHKATETFDISGRPPLDYSPESLATVEVLFDYLATRDHGIDEERLGEITVHFACYLLEVGRHQFGGRYAWHEPGDQPVLIVGEPDFRIALIAYDRLQSRLRGDPGDNLPFFYDGFASAVRAAVPGSDTFHG